MANIVDYIKSFYNQKGRDSKLNNQIPADFTTTRSRN